MRKPSIDSFLSGPDSLIARKIRVARASDKITKTSLAKSCKISQSMISQIEAGTKMPSLETLVKIAIALDTYPHWFLEPDYKFNEQLKNNEKLK
jgi:transcriptional regulator with XRE-family HTH domain